MTSSALFFAGSFNPIHHGHLVIAQAAAEAAGLNRVILLPSAQNPLKKDNIAPPEHRLAMCGLAVSGIPHFEVSDLELARPGPSYTIDTVHALKFPSNQKIYWLIGADQISTLPKWRQIDDLLSALHFVIAGRPGYEIPWPTLPPRFASLQSQVVPTPLLQISATEIRTRRAASLPIDFLTPPSVVRYIHDHDLYK